MKKPKVNENKGRKNKTKPVELIFSMLALRSYVLPKGLALSFLVAKAKIKTMMINMLCKDT